MHAAYQALKDSPVVTAYAPYGLGGLEYATFTFVVPNGLITNRNRARPIIQFNASSRRKVTVTAHLDDVRVVAREVNGGEHKFISELFAWQHFPQDRLAPGTELQLRFNGVNRYAAKVSDIVIWYQTDS
ncbi:MAG: hypothetical protein AAFP99_00665 [Pseudomonadota bacterium]